MHNTPCMPAAQASRRQHWRSGLALAAAAALVACGGGGDGTGAGNAAGGATTANTLCVARPEQMAIGPFRTADGDCVLGWQASAAEFDDWAARPAEVPAFYARLHADLQAQFATTFDIVVVVVPERPAAVSTQWVNWHRACTPGAAGCRRFPVLGTVRLSQVEDFEQGPVLHEIFHGYAQVGNRSVVPTTVASHWGFSSVGGQLGGWAAGSLENLGNGTYRAAGPPLTPLPGAQPLAAQGFGHTANGGNTVPYANLELFLMGLIPASDLQPVTYAESPAWVDAERGVFSASALRTLSPDQLVAALSPDEAAYVVASPKQPRGVVVLVNRSGDLPAAQLAVLNRDIDQFTLPGPALGWSAARGFVNFNFWHATGGRATLTLNRISTPRKQ